MAAPTRIQEVPTVFNTSTSPKTTSTFNALTGDVLVVRAVNADTGRTLAVSNNGTALTWANQQEVTVGSNCRVVIWTTVLAADRTGLTVTVTQSVGAEFFGFSVSTWRGSDGVGASNKTNTTGAPSLGLTTTQASSAIVIVSGDWNAVDGTTRTWRTVNGSPAAEDTYFRDSSMYTVYLGNDPDAGTAAAKTVGLSAPTGQKYSIAALEIKGTAAAAATPRNLGTLGAGT